MTPPSGRELYYEDRNGKKRDGRLHADLLKDDRTPWDLDEVALERIADMSDEELDRYLEQKQGT